jgi:hypothetical protein
VVNIYYKKESKYKVTRKTTMTEKELLKILSEIEIFIKESKENDNELNDKLDKLIKDIGE